MLSRSKGPRPASDAMLTTLPLAACKCGSAAFTQKKGALPVDVEGCVPHRLVALADRAREADPGRVDQDVEPAQALDGRGDDHLASLRGDRVHLDSLPAKDGERVPRDQAVIHRVAHHRGQGRADLWSPVLSH